MFPKEEPTMQTDLNTSSQSLDNPGFDQMAQSLSGALKDFSNESPAFLSSIVSVLRPIGDYSMKAVKFTGGYVRRHPVQTIAGVVAIGYIASRLMKNGASLPVSSDGRQY
jgi:hypothetical protein